MSQFFRGFIIRLELQGQLIFHLFLASIAAWIRIWEICGHATFNSRAEFRPIIEICPYSRNVSLNISCEKKSTDDL